MTSSGLHKSSPLNGPSKITNFRSSIVKLRKPSMRDGGIVRPHRDKAIGISRIEGLCKFTILDRKIVIISIIYGAHWKSHECPSRDLSISALERYLCDENIMAPTIVWSLHAFLTLVHKSRPSTSFIYQHLCALYETPGCTYRLIHVVEGLVWLNK